MSGSCADHKVWFGEWIIILVLNVRVSEQSLGFFDFFFYGVISLRDLGFDFECFYFILFSVVSVYMGNCILLLHYGAMELMAARH